MKGSELLICIIGISIISLSILYFPSRINIISIIGVLILLFDNYLARLRAKVAEELLLMKEEE